MTGKWLWPQSCELATQTFSEACQQPVKDTQTRVLHGSSYTASLFHLADCKSDSLNSLSKQWHHAKAKALEFKPF